MLTLSKFNDIKWPCQEQHEEQHRQQKPHSIKQQQAQQQKQQQRKNALPTLLSTFYVFLFAMLALQVADAKEEGDSCSMKAIQGECMAASKCYDRIDQYIREGLLNQNEIESCGLGPREEIICCPLRLTTTASIATVATPPTIITTPSSARPITTATATTTLRPIQVAGNGKSLDASATHFDFQEIIGSSTQSNTPQNQHADRDLNQNNKANRNMQNVGQLGQAPGVAVGQAVQSGRGFGMPQISPNHFVGVADEWNNNEPGISNKGFLINNDNRYVNTNPSLSNQNIPSSNVLFDQTNDNRLRMTTNGGRIHFTPPGQVQNQRRNHQQFHFNPSGQVIVNRPMMSRQNQRHPDRFNTILTQSQMQQQPAVIWPTPPQQNPTFFRPADRQQQQNWKSPIEIINNNMKNIGFDIVKADLISTNPPIPSSPTVWNVNEGSNSLDNFNNGAQVEMETTTAHTNWDSDPFAPFKFQGGQVDEVVNNNIGSGSTDAIDSNGNTHGAGDGSNTNANIGFLPAAGTLPTGSPDPSIVRTNKRASEEACSKLKYDPPRSLTPHILDGTPVDSGEYPHMAAIAYPEIGSGSNHVFRCGGTLIDKRFVLTAAHCVVNDDLQPQFVRLGVVSLTQPLGTGGVDVGIARVHIHQNYSQSIKYHDIALLELSNDVQFSDTIRPTCLYTDLNDPPSLMEYYVSGWGTINQKTRATSNILLKARLNIVPLTNCNDSVATASGGSHRQLMYGLQQTQLCAADPGGKKDACTGDSGGPLIMVNDATTKSYHAVGVVSVGFGCASQTPGLYTRVAAYLDFIESIVWPGQ